MTLLERSAALADAIADLRSSRDAAAQVEAFAARATHFSDAASHLRAAAARAGALRARGVSVEVDMSTAKAASTEIQGWRARVAGDPAAVLGSAGQTVQSQMLTPVKRLTAALQKASTEAWRRHARARLPRVEDETLSLLAKLPGQSAAVASFRELHVRALALADVLPSTEAEYARFDQAAAQCERVWNDIDAGDLPETLRRFIRDASSPGGASLDTLKPEVLLWLRDQGLTDGFRIRPR